MKKLIFLFMIFASSRGISQPTLELDSILSAITNNYPSIKSYDASIRSLDAAAKGARNWDAPLVSTGLWMTPYDPNLWKRQSNGATGMGQYMISVQQMFPNRKKLDADEKYMQGMSSVETEKRNAVMNELYAAAKQNYFQWIVLKKKLVTIYQDSLMLDFMIRNAELRYKNNLGKISAYYKVRASLGNLEVLRIKIENEIVEKKIALNTLMNRGKEINFEIDTAYYIRPLKLMSADSIFLSYSRSEIRAVEKDILLISLQEDAERGKLKPEFGIRYDNMFGFGGFPMQYSLMGMVRLPMANWSSKAAKANVESLKWKAESLNRQKQSLINEAAGNSYGLQQAIIAKQKQIQLFQYSILPALRKNFQTMQLGYEQNTEELFTLYDAWEALNKTQLEYLEQLQQLLLMQIELERILEIK